MNLRESIDRSTKELVVKSILAVLPSFAVLSIGAIAYHYLEPCFARLVAASAFLVFLLPYAKIVLKSNLSILLLPKEKLPTSLFIGYIGGIMLGTLILFTVPEAWNGQSHKIFQKPFYFLLSPPLGIFGPCGIGILLAAIGEKLLFRGLLLNWFLRFFRRPVIAICLTNLLFILVHLPAILASGPHKLIRLFINDFAMCWVYIRLRNLYLPITWHYSYNLLAYLVLAS